MNICFKSCLSSPILNSIRDTKLLNPLKNKLTAKVVLLALVIFGGFVTIYFIGRYLLKERKINNINPLEERPSPKAGDKVQHEADKNHLLNPIEKKGSSKSSEEMLEEDLEKESPPQEKAVSPIVLQNSEQESLEAKELMDGVVVKVLPDGSILNGEFLNGLLNGRGKTIYTSSIVWEGNYQEGRIVGKGIVRISKHEAREAEFIYDDLRSTLKIVFVDGDFWEGKFENGLLNGWGKMFYQTGEIREGEFKNNQLCGQGTLTLPDGRILKGEFKDNLLSGKGTYTYSNKIHEGDFQVNSLDGQGKITFKEGEVWEGNFEGDWLHGQGKITKPSGVIIEGIFHLDPCKRFDYPHDLDGQKKVTLKNGEIWEGNYIAGLLNGTGKIFFPNGDTWDGEFKDNKPHGSLLKTFPDNTTVKGTYVEGSLQGQVIKITSPEGEMQEIEIPHKTGQG